jgi:uncharacterized membrane protein YagU involved in acid resistance
MKAVRSVTPLGSVGRGLAAGVLGTAVMTGWQILAAKPQGSEEVAENASSVPADPWEQASVPAKVAKRVGEGVFKRDVSPDLIPLLTNAMHWGYGTGWGSVYGLVAGSRGRSRLRDGALFGAGVWVMSYVQLVPMGLYDPPWTYPAKELALDLSYHLAYGAGLAGGYRILDRG